MSQYGPYAEFLTRLTLRVKDSDDNHLEEIPAQILEAFTGYCLSGNYEISYNIVSWLTLRVNDFLGKGGFFDTCGILLFLLNKVGFLLNFTA